MLDVRWQREGSDKLGHPQHLTLGDVAKWRV